MSQSLLLADGQQWTLVLSRVPSGVKGLFSQLLGTLQEMATLPKMTPLFRAAHVQSLTNMGL